MIPDCPVVDIEIAIEGLGFDTAIDGTLDPRPRRAAAPSEVLDELQTIVGIGPSRLNSSWSVERARPMSSRPTRNASTPS